MINKAATINARIEPMLKHKAEAILHKVGLSTADAIRIFYSQICLNNGLPFEVRLPNDETLDAIHELESSQNRKKYDSMKELWDDVESA